MATLQVTASTQQAVGAFNALAASINNVNSQFQQLASTMSTGQSVSVRYGSAIERAVIGGFEKLKAVVSGVIGAVQLFGGVLSLTFKQLLRELDRLQGFNAIMSVSAKSTESAAYAYDFLRKTADRLGQQFDGLAINYSKLVAAIPPGVNQLNIANKAFLGVSMAARTLHSTNQETQLMFYAVTQMASKGVVSMEELRRQLGEKLPGVIQIAANALQTTPEKLEQAIRKGIVNSEKFLDVFSDALIRTFADSSEKASTSVSASINRLTNVWTDFVKNILDSGSGDAIVRVFDALREKLSDPYLIERFGLLVKFLADRFTDFITNITADDLRTGFDTMSNGIQLLINLFGKLIEAITWITNNSTQALTILGLLSGAAAGAAGGAALGSIVPGVGTAAGAVGGAVLGATGGAGGGYYLGQQVAPTQEQLSRRLAEDSAAQLALQKRTADQQFVQYQLLIPALRSFKGLNSLRGLDNLFKPENLTREMVSAVTSILGDTRFKTDAQRVEGLRTFAKTGVILGPAQATLDSVIGGNPSTNAAARAAQRSEDSTYYRAFGLNPTYPKEIDNLTKMLEKGRLTQDQYNEAVQDLINKQPYMIENLKAERQAAEANNREFEKFMKTLVDQIKVREDLRIGLEQDLRLAGMRGDELRIEQQVMSEQIKFRQAGLEMSDQELSDLREKLRLIESIRQVTAAEQQLLSATVDRWLPQIQMLQGIDRALTDPTSGLTQQQASDYVVNQDSNTQGSQQWMDAQRRSMEEYYIFVDTLRKRDLVSEETAQQMKARAQLQYDSVRIQQTGEFFSNLASLSRSGNRKLAAVGRAAAVATATVDGYVAIQKALASAPPPVNYALAAAVGVATAANISSILGVGGFYNGGYTGHGSRGSVAGVVHGQEFVVNASATSRNRAALEAMNAGRNVSTSAQVVNNFYVTNNSSADVKTEERSNESGGIDYVVLIEDVTAKSVAKNGKLAQQLQRTYGLNRAAGAVR